MGIEADGILYHSTEKQVGEDQKRDAMLAQSGWTIIRFTDNEIEKRIRGVVETILQTVKQKEKWLKEKYGKDAEKKKE